MHCSTCGDERTFEQPPCPDGHGAECPERACAECGEAVLIGGPVELDRGAGSDPVPSPDPAREASLSGPSARRTTGASGGAASARAVA